MSRIVRSTDVRAALRSRQRGFLLNPFRFGGGGGGDPYFANVPLLLHMNGANGSTTFTDSSGTPKTVTAYNGAAISTAWSKFGGASGLFDGTNDYIDTPDNAGFTLGTSDFTIEGWVRFNAVTAAIFAIAGQCNSAGANTSLSFTIQKSAANKLDAFCCSGGSVIGRCTGTTTVTTGVDYYFAYRRSGTGFGLYVNSTTPEATATSSSSVNDSSSRLAIGRLGEYSAFYGNMYVDDFRMTVGVARTIVVPTAQFPDF